MRFRLTLLMVAVMSLVSVAALSACAPAATPTAPPTTAPTVPPTASIPQPTFAPPAQAVQATKVPTTTSAQSAQPQGTLVIGTSVDLTSLDPAVIGDQTTMAVLANIYEALLLRKTNTMQPVPLLAESYRMVDPTTWEFKLRQGVKFQDGEDFNADSVKFTIERNLRPELKAPHRSFISAIKEVKVIDPYTVQFITNGPYPALPAALTGFTGQMLPPKYVQEHGDQYLASHPIGTGPYKFVEWVKDDHVTLEANPDYWGEPPKIKTLIFKPMREASTRIAAIQTGAADIVTNVPADQAAALNNSSNFSIQAVPSLLVVYFGIDSITPGPLTNQQVRQAINLAIDRQTIVKDILRGYGKVSSSAVSDEVFGFDSSLTPYPYDPAKAKELLKAAGYPNGFSLTLDGPIGRYSMDTDVEQAVAGYLQNIGIQAKVRTHEWGQYASMHFGVDNPGSLYMLGWGGSGTFIPELALTPLFKSGENFSTTKDPELDKLMQMGGQSTDPATRAGYFKQAQQRIYDQAYRVFLFQQDDIYGVSNRVQNWQPRTDEFILFKDMSVNSDTSVKP